MPESEIKKRVPYSRKPAEMSVDEWQAELSVPSIITSEYKEY